ncbi:hypothetical protein F5Y14DRAFT_466226 [Nemania sp. NC0429]|nr:hypothetical protein F5Y14DRAFT_466226 [Nemania sp. NC0429]
MAHKSQEEDQKPSPLPGEMCLRNRRRVATKPEPKKAAYDEEKEVEGKGDHVPIRGFKLETPTPRRALELLQCAVYILFFMQGLYHICSVAGYLPGKLVCLTYTDTDATYARARARAQCDAFVEPVGRTATVCIWAASACIVLRRLDKREGKLIFGFCAVVGVLASVALVATAALSSFGYWASS